MQMIRDALGPERLAEFRKMFDAADHETEERRAAKLDDRLRADQDARAEAAERNRHERRKAAALARPLAVLLASTALAAQAWADTLPVPTVATAPSATTVDLTNTANVLLSLAAAAVAAAIPILIPFVLKRLGVANNADLSAKLATAADAAAGAAYQYALSHEGGLARVDVHDAAIAHGVTYLTSEMQPLLDTLGVTPARAGDMVKARLGALLAGDPTVTAGAPSQVPAPPPPIPAPPPVHVVAPPPVVLPAAPAGGA